jgi:predicted PurR-regulated permease PerM
MPDQTPMPPTLDCRPTGPALPGATITVPRWVQLATLPVLLLIAWLLLGIIGRAILMFIVAALIALVLNPVVKLLERLRVPRYVGVFVVYLVFVALVAGVLALVVPPLIGQARDLVADIPGMAEGARSGIEEVQKLADRLNVNVDVRQEVESFATSIDRYIPALSKGVYGLGRSLATTIAIGFIVIVVSIYMLLDSKRIAHAFIDHFPTGSPVDGAEYVRLAQSAVASYVKAQVLLSVILGTSAGVAMWLLGVTGVFPSGETYALFFGAWTAIMELIPYVGPVLAAVPPSIVALLDSPLTMLWVILTYLAIQQIEGHIVTPTVMGSRFRVHPLIVIFAILAGNEIHGVIGMFVAIPMIPLVKETIDFMRPRVRLESWQTRMNDALDLDSDSSGAPRATVDETRDDSPARGPRADDSPR